MGRITALTIALLLRGTLAGAAEASLTAVAERSTPGLGVEQNALIFKGRTARWVTSSNLLDPPTSSATLGTRAASMNPKLEAELALLRNARARAKGAAASKAAFARSGQVPEDPGAERHGLRLLLDGAQVRRGSSYYAQAEAALVHAGQLADWTPEDAVRVSWEKNGDLVVTRLEAAGSSPKAGRKSIFRATDLCRSAGRTARGIEKWTCRIEGYGVAYLTPASFE